MTVRKSTLFAFLLASSVALAVPLAAQAGPGMGGCRGDMHGGAGMGYDKGGMRMLRGLDLTEAQRDQIFELKHAQMPKMRDQVKVMRELRGQLRDAAMSDAYDAAKVKALTEQQAAAMAAMTQLRLANQHAVYQVLTAEQREQLKSRRAARAERRGDMRQGMMRGDRSADT
ncbi:Spy/CpxP family protein refolding chaperone [Denitromonas iodatirespirans]|uniref:Spy/CpxP family protein refolding chaperone n=1 Tax=Denitromonas iodatirespirans TaxID=2795389 RepID=A0A944HAJ4_DENI1|nr:Spy/CpxP family protein refolding chaperone [Denitromonas iodatirespirans]MBT0963520.1 Spy/CpxP family protein refolding chaperone [Denitromonas iodatirespirans]